MMKNKKSGIASGLFFYNEFIHQNEYLRPTWLIQRELVAG